MKNSSIDCLTLRTQVFFDPFRAAVPFGDKLLEIRLVCPPNGAAVLDAHVLAFPSINRFLSSSGEWFSSDQRW